MIVYLFGMPSARKIAQILLTFDGGVYLAMMMPTGILAFETQTRDFELLLGLDVSSGGGPKKRMPEDHDEHEEDLSPGSDFREKNH